MSFTTLICVSDLAMQVNNPQWVICDCRHDLTRYHSGREAYKQSHIPGARFLHLDEDLSGPKNGLNGRHPLPHPQTLALRLGALGISNQTQVIVYDDQDGVYAARLWWMMRWIGHTNVAVLNGGFKHWIASGQPVNDQRPTWAPLNYQAKLVNGLTVSSQNIVQQLANPEWIVLDARRADRVRGENETLDPVAGHIPGAKNRFFKNNLTLDGLFKSPEVLQAEFTQQNLVNHPSTLVHQCGSGVSACHNLLAMEWANVKGSKLYPGSWSEWISHPQRPIARGLP